MRQQVEALMAQTSELQTQHSNAIAFLRGRAAKATSEAAKAVFEREIRSKEQKHATDLQRIEAQAATALEMFEQGQNAAPSHEQPPVVPPARSAQRMSGALALAFAADARTPVPQTEARGQALKWLDGQERKGATLSSSSEVNSIIAADPADNPPRLQAPRLQQRTVSAGRKGRMQAVRKAYEALGVSREISDSDLDRVYATLIAKEDPADKPAELAGYYEKRTKSLHEAYACIKSHRTGSSPSVCEGASSPGRPHVVRRGSSDLAI